MAEFDTWYGRDAGIQRTPYDAITEVEINEVEINEDNRSSLNFLGFQRESTRPGFFMPFQSGNDVLLQLKAPPAMLIIGLCKIVGAVTDLVQSLSMCVTNLLFLDIEKTWDSTNAFFKSLFNIFDYILTTVVDTLWELTTLIMRTVASCFYGVVAGVDSIQAYFTPPQSTNEQSNEGGINLIAVDTEKSEESDNEAATVNTIQY